MRRTVCAEEEKREDCSGWVVLWCGGIYSVSPQFTLFNLNCTIRTFKIKQVLIFIQHLKKISCPADIIEWRSSSWNCLEVCSRIKEGHPQQSFHVALWQCG